MMRILRLTPLLLVLLSPAVWGQDFLRMPDSLHARWRCSVSAGNGWNQAGYDARGWTTPVFGIPGRYPQWADPEDQALHLFMWHAGGANTGKPVYFRRNVYLPSQVTEASINLCADDQFMLYVNGRSLMQSQEAHKDRGFDITSQLQRGANVIAVQAKDVRPPGYGLLVAPMITQAFRMDDGSWQYSANGRTGWQKAAADKSAPIKVEGIERPFRCLTAPGGMKDFSTAYFRRTIQVDGFPLEAPTVILGDDSYELKVNGKLVTLEKRLERAWMPRKVDIAPFLKPGANTIMVKVTNDWGPGRFYCVPEVTMTF